MTTSLPEPAMPGESLADADTPAILAERQALKGASVSGVIVNMSAQGIRFGLRFAYQILIARLLLPGDFGLVALAAPAITFIQLFADLGLSQATIQHRDIRQSQLSFLFWLNVAAGLLLAGVCVAIAPLVARFYGDPRAAGVIVASGGLLLLSSFYSQHMALLNRHMRFRALAGMDLATFVLGSAAGLAAAWFGAGYWAILINQAVTTGMGLILAWSLSRWIPGRPGPVAEMKALMAFGGNITTANFVGFFTRNTDNILIGRFLGEQALGLYDRAFKLMLLPFGQISEPFTKVAIPLLSRSLDQPEFYRRAYQRMLEAVLLLLYPGLVFVIATSHELITLALGQRWGEVTPIFALLGIDAFVAPLGNSMGWLFVSQGRTREMRNWGVVTAALFISAFIIGLRWGPQGVAAGYSAAGLTEISFLWHIATRRGPLRGRDFLSLVAPFLFGILVSFAVVLGLRHFLPRGVATLALEGFCSYAAFVAALAMLPRGRRVLQEVSGQIRKLAARLRPATPTRRHGVGVMDVGCPLKESSNAG